MWRRQRGQRGRAAWQCALTLCAPVDEEAVAQARRRRRAPPDPAVNQLAWTKDDAQVQSLIWNKGIWLKYQDKAIWSKYQTIRTSVFG